MESYTHRKIDCAPVVQCNASGRACDLSLSDYIRSQFVAVSFRNISDFCRAMLCISATYAVMGYCVSVTFVDHVKTNKHIFEMFLPPGSHTILVFPYQTGWRYSDSNPLTGASNAGG